MKRSTAFFVGFLSCYSIGAALTYRALDVLAFKNLPPLRYSLTWPSVILATADAIRDAKRD